jgi:RNA polymerase sigma factor (sigma-70 family)
MQESVSHWIAGIKSGNDEAARKLWDRYSVRLLELARRRLSNSPPGMSDEEDVVQSVFACVCRGAAAGRFAQLENRDELWWLLLLITRRKAAAQLRRELAEKRGGGRVRTETALALQADGNKDYNLDELMGDEPTPEFLVLMEEENERLLSLLRDDRLRQIAGSRLEGYTIQEIATKLGVSTRSIERKLRLIRNRWATEISR